MDPMRRSRGSKLSPKGAQEGPKNCQKAVQEHLESTRGNLLNLRSRLHGSVILRGRGALERHFGRQVGAQNGVQVRLGSSNWRPSALGQPNLAPKCPLAAQLGAQVEPKGHPRGQSGSQKAPKRLQVEPKRRPRRLQEQPEQKSKSTWRAEKAIIKQVAKVP